MKKHAFRRFAALRLGLLAIALVAVVPLRPVQVGLAQQGSPPPTYDYDATLPGTQGPTSPFVATYERRELRTFHFNVYVLVPLAELQALLPPGFNAIAASSGSNTAWVVLGFYFHLRAEQGGQSFGPASAVQFVFPVLNTNTNPQRGEQALLVVENSDRATSDAINTLFGSGASRLAKVKAEIVEEDGKLRVKFDVRDDGINLNLQAQAEGPAAMTTRFKSDPVTYATRFLGPNRSYRWSQQYEASSVPVASANVKVETPDGRLNLK